MDYGTDVNLIIVIAKYNRGVIFLDRNLKNRQSTVVASFSGVASESACALGAL